MRKIKFVFIFAILSTFSHIYASSVVFQIVQNDSAAEDVLETTVILGQGIMDAFFEYGDIVMDAPTLLAKSHSERNSETEKTLKDASEGFMDYYVVITLDYERSNLPDPEAVQLDGIKGLSWKMIKVNTKENVSSGSRKVIKRGKEDDSVLEVRNFATDLAKQIKQGLK